MLGVTATHLSTCQELRDCKWPLCQTSCDGWVSLASRGSKAQEENEGDRRRRKGVNVNIEYWKGRFSDTHRTCTEIHPEGGHKHETIKVFLVKYWRCLSICESEGALGLVWFHDFGALEKTAMVSLSWPEPDVSPGESPGWETLTKLHQTFVSVLKYVDSGSWKSVKSCSFWSNTPPGFPKYSLGLLYWRGQRKGQKGRE